MFGILLKISNHSQVDVKWTNRFDCDFLTHLTLCRRVVRLNFVVRAIDEILIKINKPAQCVSMKLCLNFVKYFICDQNVVVLFDIFIDVYTLHRISNAFHFSASTSIVNLSAMCMYTCIVFVFVDLFTLVLLYIYMHWLVVSQGIRSFYIIIPKHKTQNKRRME